MSHAVVIVNESQRVAVALAVVADFRGQLIAAIISEVRLHSIHSVMGVSWAGCREKGAPQSHRSSTGTGRRVKSTPWKPGRRSCFLADSRSAKHVCRLYL